jgi:TolA-binding protein
MKVTTDFPQAQGTTVPDAYYKLGQTYEHLNQIDAAKQAYQTVMQKFPGTTSATLANSSLQRLNKR